MVWADRLASDSDLICPGFVGVSKLARSFRFSRVARDQMQGYSRLPRIKCYGSSVFNIVDVGASLRLSKAVGRVYKPLLFTPEIKNQILSKSRIGMISISDYSHDDPS